MPWYPISSKFWRFRIGFSDLSRSKVNFFSPTQVQAWTNFYVEEEKQQTSFSSEKYMLMLMRYGVPDIGNPLTNDQEDYFLLHPGGFIAGEFDRCLRAAQTVLDTQRGEQALFRLGMLSHLNCPMISAKHYWADDDIKYGMALACMEGRWELYGARPSRVIVNALRNSLLEPQVAPGILIARRMTEEEWYPAPWKRINSMSVENTTQLPEAPTIDLSKWRSLRGKDDPSEDHPSLDLPLEDHL